MRAASSVSGGELLPFVIKATNFVAIFIGDRQARIGQRHAGGCHRKLAGPRNTPGFLRLQVLTRIEPGHLASNTARQIAGVVTA